MQSTMEVREPTRIAQHAQRTPSSGEGRSRHVNVGQTERLASALAGGFALALGLSRRSAPGTVMAALGSALVYRGVSGHCHVYGALGHDTSQPASPVGRIAAPAAKVEVQSQATMFGSPKELYQRFRSPGTMSQLFGDFADVRELSNGRSEWRVHGPLHTELTFETEIIEEREGELLRWRSVADAPAQCTGTLHLRAAPGDRGTELSLTLSLLPPGGAIGRALTKLVRPLPEWVAMRALRHFKALVEAGELPSLHHNPAARPSENV